MKKIMQWVLVATLICGASVFTSCSSDNDDNPAQAQAKKDRKEFVKHTRSVLKDLAENLNFASWEYANTASMQFNEKVLNTPEFRSSVMWGTLLKSLLTVKAVEPGSDLAEKGYTKYMTIDMNALKYRFTQTADNKDFDRDDADDFEVIMNGYNPITQQVENGIYKIVLKTAGTSVRFAVPFRSVEGAALLYVLPAEFQFTLSSKITGTWHDDFSGTLHYQLPAGAEDDSKGYSLDANILSDVTLANGKTDKTQLYLSVASDRVNGLATVQTSWTQGGRKVIDLSIKESGSNMGGISNLDLSQFTTSSSIFEVIGSILSTRNIDEAKLTFFDDLTTTFSIQNLQAFLELEYEYRTIGRNYASKEVIDEYVEKMNQIAKAEITCKGVNQTIPMCLMGAKVGVDYWVLYGFKFADEPNYISLKELLDPESLEYCINILDHGVDPMQQSVIVGRQLLEFILSLTTFMTMPDE